MSSTLVAEDKDLSSDNKSTDKKEIENEELENMMNAENKTQDAGNEAKTDKTEDETPVTVAAKAAALVEEGREVKPKKIPIGGIKMPGFFTRSKSKEKCNKVSRIKDIIRSVIGIFESYLKFYSKYVLLFHRIPKTMEPIMNY